MRRVILASGSPRRRELLAQTGLEFEVIPGNVDEAAVIAALEETPSREKVFADPAGETERRRLSGSAEEESVQKNIRPGQPFPARVVEALSAAKAEAVAKDIAEGVVIGADTVVWNGEILGKPKDRADAFAMLRALQGRTHSVFTGVTVLVKEPAETVQKSGTEVRAAICGAKQEGGAGSASTACGAKQGRGAEAGSKNITSRYTFSCETRVRVYPMTEQETEQYLDAGEYADKAGAYGIQGKFGLWVQGIEGDYNNVVGLPLSALWQVLRLLF